MWVREAFVGTPIEAHNGFHKVLDVVASGEACSLENAHRIEPTHVSEMTRENVGRPLPREQNEHGLDTICRSHRHSLVQRQYRLRFQEA
jgi:hypothetical protein